MNSDFDEKSLICVEFGVVSKCLRELCDVEIFAGLIWLILFPVICCEYLILLIMLWLDLFDALMLLEGLNISDGHR